MKVLLVSDSEELSRTIPVVLKVRWPNLSLFCTSEARECLELIHREQPCIAMLHLDAGPEDCFELISEIRSFSDVPLISSVPMEFIAKVNALLRRCQSPNKSCIFSFLDGKLSIDSCKRQVSVLGKSVKLTPTEYKILWQLAQNEGRIVSKESLVRTVWGPSYIDYVECLKKYVYRLRCKIEEDPAAPEIVLTERGVGYFMASSE